MFNSIIGELTNQPTTRRTSTRRNRYYRAPKNFMQLECKFQFSVFIQFKLQFLPLLPLFIHLQPLHEVCYVLIIENITLNYSNTLLRTSTEARRQRANGPSSGGTWRFNNYTLNYCLGTSPELHNALDLICPPVGTAYFEV